jgi:hypothetical protein
MKSPSSTSLLSYASSSKKGWHLTKKKAWGAIVEDRREMKPYFEFPENETEAEKEIWKQALSKYKEILKAKKSFVVAET